jgi:PAS domain S-box-containing protein
VGAVTQTVWGRVPLWARALMFAAAYMFAVEVGHVYLGRTTLPVFWPQSGLFLAVLLLCEPRTWPVFLLAGLAGNGAIDLLEGKPPLAASVLAIGNALAALAGATLFRRFAGPTPRLDTVRQVLGLTVLAALAATALATLAVTAAASPVLGIADTLAAWRTWALANAVGIVVFSPLFLTVAHGLTDLRTLAYARGTGLSRVVLGGVAATALMALAAWLVFSPQYGDGRWKFLLILGALVAGIRVGPLGGATALSAAALAGTWALADAASRLGQTVLPDRILEFQAFLTVTGIALLGLSAVNAGRVRAAVEARVVSEKYRVLLDEFPTGVTITDEAGEIVEISRRAEKILGIGETEHKARGLDGPAWTIIRPDGSPMPPEEYASVRALRTGDRVEGQVAGIVKPDGTTWIRITAAPISAGGYGVAVAYDDITDRKQAEEELAKHKRDLEGLVSDRTEELVRANEALKEASEAKSRFLANMSHELRTPLNSVIGFSGILLQGMTGPLADEQRRQIEMVHSSGDRLLTLVNDILDLARIESGATRIDATTFDLRETLSDTVRTVTPLAAAKGLAIHYVRPPRVLKMTTDRKKVEQIVLNLLTNAVKFTDWGTVTLTAVLADGAIEIAIADTGIGIPSAQLPYIMDDFHQVDRADGMKPQGTGLGLAISRRLAAMLGGSLTAESRIGRGSVFTLRLPRAV